MKHRFAYCPDNLSAEIHWHVMTATCTWCLQESIVEFETRYRECPELFIQHLVWYLQ